MNNVNNFEVAVKSKFRFPYKGLISTEDLFDLKVSELDSVYKVLNSQLKQVSEESLMNTKSKEDKELELKIEIVKYVFNQKVEEQNKRTQEKENYEKKQKIAAILATKKDEALMNKTPEELEEMLKNM